MNLTIQKVDMYVQNLHTLTTFVKYKINIVRPCKNEIKRKLSKNNETFKNNITLKMCLTKQN